MHCCSSGVCRQEGRLNDVPEIILNLELAKLEVRIIENL